MPYTPRLSKNSPVAMEGNEYWYSNYNPFYATGEWGLPNCTCYAWGRWGEISGGETLYLPRGDGGTWFDAARISGIYETGQVAQLGAIACYSDPVGMGHVAVVEVINEDGSIITSNSGYYRGTPGTSEYEWYYFHTWEHPSNYSRPGYIFQGFIYNPHEPVPIGSNNIILLGGAKVRRRRNDTGKSKHAYSIRN